MDVPVASLPLEIATLHDEPSVVSTPPSTLCDTRVVNSVLVHLLHCRELFRFRSVPAWVQSNEYRTSFLLSARTAADKYMSMIKNAQQGSGSSLKPKYQLGELKAEVRDQLRDTYPCCLCCYGI